MGLEEWVANRWLVPHVATRAEVAALPARALRREAGGGNALRLLAALAKSGIAPANPVPCARCGLRPQRLNGGSAQD
jgi:hypothetical protein